MAASCAELISLMTAEQIVERIRERVNCPWSEDTVDRFVAGDPSTPVTGIATTFMATVSVLRQAAELGCNLVVTHEPTFYAHREDPDLPADDAVRAAKEALIRRHGMVVWRFHDHLHRMTPDGILEGMTRLLGWEAAKTDTPAVFEIPRITARQLARRMKARLECRGLRLVGDPNAEVSRVALCPGAAAAGMQMALLRRPDVQALLVGESREWETVEFARDAAALGAEKALIVLGHAASEEAGMKYAADFLAEFITEIPVRLLPAEEPFRVV
jgi:putative NIF3 family GTP cyclohydrolase 1 type 2